MKNIFCLFDACIIEGRSIGAVKLKSTLGWPSLQARRNYLKCVLVHKCLHRIAPLYLLSEFRHAHLFHGYNTRSRDLLRPPFAKTTKYTECKYGRPLGCRPGRVMKVRLVRPRCFVLTMLPLKSLASWMG